jgi:hypothetical protein
MQHPSLRAAPPPARRLVIGATAAASALLLIFAFAGCDEDVTLIDPGPFFSYDRDNAWPATCTGPRGPAAVPPPSGLVIEACPNPAPPGAKEITFRFRLDVRRPRVNLGIVNTSGLIVARLLEDYPAEADREVDVQWLLDGVSPGDYRAYFLADDIESWGDLRVE